MMADAYSTYSNNVVGGKKKKKRMYKQLKFGFRIVSEIFSIWNVYGLEDSRCQFLDTDPQSNPIQNPNRLFIF